MIKSNYIINYFIILLIVLSGNVYFSLAHPKESRYILIASTLILLLYNLLNKTLVFRKKSLVKLLILLCLIATNFLFNTQNGINIKDLFFLIAIISSVYVLKERIGIDSFKTSYIYIMKWACIVSLVCYYLSILNILSINQFPFYTENMLGSYVFKYTFYHSWGWGIGTTRNPGMFWEPGAFQCYINLAILFLVFDKSNNIQHKTSSYIIFIIALVSTQSTTGYIIMGLVILYAVLTLKIKIKNKIVRVLLIFISILSVIYFINNDVVSDKFNEDNSSYLVRNNDLKQSLNMIKDSPIFGVGYLSDKQYSEQKLKNIEKNSNGILIFIIQFGLITFMFYLALLYRGIKKMFSVKFMDAIFILIILMIMFSTEAIVLYPIWLYLLL